MKLFYYAARLVEKMKPNAIHNCNIDKTAHKGYGNQIIESQIGKYSYIGNKSTVCHAKIGAFCSVAPNVIIGGAAHPIDFVSTSPIFHRGRNVLSKNFADKAFDPFKRTTIGNDVWIGNNCIIKQGVKIGNGAVIGMGSVVTKDVGDYEIWAGNPAKLIRKRFDDETIEKLLKIKWWELSDEQIKKYADCFDSPEKFIERYNDET